MDLRASLTKSLLNPEPVQVELAFFDSTIVLLRAKRVTIRANWIRLLGVLEVQRSNESRVPRNIPLNLAPSDHTYVLNRDRIAQITVFNETSALVWDL